MPVSKQNIAKMHMLQTPNETMALGLELNTELSEGALKHALPKEQVPDADILLQKYDEAKGVRIPAQCRPGSPVILGHLC